ncbi:hypothetical protein SAMN05877838_2102 [Hoeflea halophila]|uniref:Uncharacterized protein n=1 Tax=Hoeflea halophila TaxID=714899 RepID=A0A286ICY4_9HYPH|nr:hypothetical protein [Hoeflea halophila]SOE17209.1 hypothetical protein SAMN05877838_2102 [Hoeflea halophila]
MDKNNKDGNAVLSTIRLKQGFIILFAAVAFFMTAYATSGGARIFMTETYAWVGITALAVGFLAFTSLVLGDGISSNRITQIALVMPFYLVAVAICWISSFASYHQQFLSVGGSDLANAETNLRQMGLYAHNINKEMNERYLDEKAELLGDEALKDYSTRMGALTDELRDRDKKREIASELQTLIETRKVELRNRQGELKTQQGEVERNLAKLTTEIGELEALVAATEARVAASVERVDNLEIALKQEEGEPGVSPASKAILLADGLASQLTDDPACNRRRRAGTGGGLKGTCYNALGENLADSRAELASLRKDQEAARNRLLAANQEQAALQSQVVQIAQDLDTTTSQLGEDVASGYTLDADGFLQSVNAFIDTPSQTTFKQTASYCQVVTEVLSDLKSVSDLPACEPQALMAVFRQIDTLDAEQAAFAQACDETDRRKQIIDDLRGEMLDLSGPERLKPVTRAYDEMRADVLETCLVAAEQRGLEGGPYREDLASLYDRINPSQDAISKAIGKVEALFNGTASARDYFPALLALLQELSLLLSKLFWDANVVSKASKRKEDLDIADLDLDAKPDDPDSVLAAKNVILNTVFDKQGYLLPHLYDEEYSHEMRSQMRLIVDSLFRKQLARKTGRGILISEQGLAEVGRRIRRHNDTAHPGGAEAEPPATEASGMVAEKNVAEPQGETATGSSNEDKPVARPVPAQHGLAAAQAEQLEEAEANSTQRPRRRRPVVVRPNFRREL